MYQRQIGGNNVSGRRRRPSSQAPSPGTLKRIGEVRALVRRDPPDHPWDLALMRTPGSRSGELSTERCVTRDGVSEMETIGFIGLGEMGRQLAGRLLDSGYTDNGTNKPRSKAQELVDHGLQRRDTSREVAGQADAAALDAVTAELDGVLAGLRDRKLYVDMSTVNPHINEALATSVQAIGAEIARQAPLRTRQDHRVGAPAGLGLLS